MKKITYYFSMIFMAVMMLSLTSCDEDADIAYALNGNWKGYMQTQLDYDGRYYQSNMSEVTFNSGYDSGDGYWIDYYSNAPWDYVANRITWRVSGTTIYINFLDTQEKAVIRNYHLDDNGYFYGDIDFNSTNRWISFQLSRSIRPTGTIITGMVPTAGIILGDITATPRHAVITRKNSRRVLRSRTTAPCCRSDSFRKTNKF